MEYYGTAQKRRTVNYVWVSFVAIVTLLLGWAANTAVALITDWSGSQAWLAVPLATMLVTVLTAVATAHVRTYEPTVADVSQGADRGRTTASGGTRLPFVVSAGVVAVLVGAIGLTLTLGVRFAVGWVTGDEVGVERLAEPVAVEAQGLSLSVESIEQTRHFTRVTVLAANGVSNSIRLPLFGNAVLQSGAGATVEADPFRSDWVDQLAPGSTQRGVIVFTGHLPDEARFARLSFANVFGSGFGGPRSIVVPGMPLRPPGGPG